MMHQSGIGHRFQDFQDLIAGRRLALSHLAFGLGFESARGVWLGLPVMFATSFWQSPNE